MFNQENILQEFSSVSTSDYLLLKFWKELQISLIAETSPTTFDPWTAVFWIPYHFLNLILFSVYHEQFVLPIP